MFQQCDVSVVIGTYNRSEMLVGALDSILGQDNSTTFEVIVVDNNSNDSTREVVASYIKKGHHNLRYIFEPKQGISHARNTGLVNSRAPIIAFTDDDVRVTDGWISGIKREFDRHPEVDFVGGKILPHWKTSPPAWLTRDHWWALALLDYGDAAFYVNADNALCLPNANASFRSDVFERFGLFSPAFSGREDHEFLLRLWMRGRRGLYVPGIVVKAEVQPERLKKQYHRKWNATTGKFNSMMRLNEIMASDGRIIGEQPELVTLFGVPAFVYRQLLATCGRWLRAIVLGHEASALSSTNRFYYFCGYIAKRYEQTSPRHHPSPITEVVRFAKTLLKKKIVRTLHLNRSRIPEN